MNIVTKQEKETRIKTVKRYFADDGTEFETEGECAKYETDIRLKHLAEKYKLKEIYSVPDFIFSGFTCCSYTFCIPKENDIKELSVLLDILINNVLDVDEAGNFEVDYERVLGNVRKNDKSTEKLSGMKLEEGKIYVFFVHHNECEGSYDYFFLDTFFRRNGKKRVAERSEKV